MSSVSNIGTGNRPAGPVPPAAAKPRKANRPAPAKPTADTKTAEGTDEERHSPFSLAFWRNSSSFLVSSVVHLIALIVLALVTLAMPDEDGDRTLMAQIDGTAEEFEESPLESELEEIELDQTVALPTQLKDPGIAALGEAPTAVAEVAVGNVKGYDTSTMGDIGLLTGSDGKGFASHGTGTGGEATFCGQKASGNKFAFVVDGSKSMKNHGWEACKAELMRSISQLKPTQQFYVVFFADKDYRMFGPGNEADTMVYATPENIQKLYMWMYNFELVLRTDPFTSVECVMNLKPDAMYLLGDGQFTDGGKTERYLLANNKKEDEYGDEVAKMSVHTIAFYSDQGGTVLQRIAKANSGVYRFVPPPGGVVHKPPKKPGAQNPAAKKPGAKKPGAKKAGQAKKPGANKKKKP